MKYTFNSDAWENDFSYAYSLVAKSFTPFTKAPDCIHNAYNDEICGYDYVSIVHRERVRKGAKVSMECSFEHYGAPLLTLANDMWTDEEGHLRYGAHYEIVAYESGCNVWFVSKAPEGITRPFVAKNCLRLRFPIAEGSVFTLHVELLERGVRVELLGQNFDLPLPELAEEVYLGVTACEGLNRFYSVELEK